MGLSSRDVALAMGMVRSGPTDVKLGMEAAGVVRRVGPSVQNVAVGDRVMGLAPNGCISTLARLRAAAMVRLPDDMSFEAAATVPL